MIAQDPLREGQAVLRIDRREDPPEFVPLSESEGRHGVEDAWDVVLDMHVGAARPARRPELRGSPVVTDVGEAPCTGSVDVDHLDQVIKLRDEADSLLLQRDRLPVSAEQGRGRAEGVESSRQQVGPAHPPGHGHRFLGGALILPHPFGIRLRLGEPPTPSSTSLQQAKSLLAVALIEHAEPKLEVGGSLRPARQIAASTLASGSGARGGSRSGGPRRGGRQH